ncbi:hypothetical protein [Caballeronia sp. INDeC2]|uniref:hypothetical protein n=1 Tax=Caballeronia sp. INDeC2 TaxID=2921747 RepID=UPI002027ACE0|nr:hypothetical protein [Caballeronia sp. INDeC2]
MEARFFTLTDAAFERGRAAEPAVDEAAQHGEDRDPRYPPGGEAVECVAEPGAAQHGGGEHHHDQDERRTMLVFDTGVAAGSHAELVAAQGIRAGGLIHSVIPTVVDLCLHESTQSGTWTTPE